MDINKKAEHAKRRLDNLDMWIPVTEELPDNQLPKLVTIEWEDERFITTAIYDNAWLDPNYLLRISGVVAWQELPIPYKG